MYFAHILLHVHEELIYDLVDSLLSLLYLTLEYLIPILDLKEELIYLSHIVYETIALSRYTLICLC